jgi:hypothetical protein
MKDNTRVGLSSFVRVLGSASRNDNLILTENSIAGLARLCSTEKEIEFDQRKPVLLLWVGKNLMNMQPFLQTRIVVENK